MVPGLTSSSCTSLHSSSVVVFSSKQGTGKQWLLRNACCRSGCMRQSCTMGAPSASSRHAAQSRFALSTNGCAGTHVLVCALRPPGPTLSTSNSLAASSLSFMGRFLQYTCDGDNPHVRMIALCHMCPVDATAHHVVASPTCTSCAEYCSTA